MAIPALFAKLASALLADYVAKAIPNLPSLGDLTSSLKNLVLGDVLKIDDIFSGDFSNITGAMLEKVKEQIAKLKAELGLSADGILEKATLDAVRNRCLREVANSKSPTFEHAGRRCCSRARFPLFYRREAV
ncbi:MAG: hypothetical protein WCJ09_00515 [Planctomycetota bacterium]